MSGAGRCILRPDHVDLFRESASYAALVAFLRRLLAASTGRATVLHSGGGKGESKTAALAQELLTASEGLLERVPPEANAGRFGNKAFRAWCDGLIPIVEAQVPNEELVAYFCGSFGSRERLDFGTGHEAQFLVFLLALARKNGEEEDIRTAKDIALSVVPRYLELAYSLQKTYRLEPAGSHGVWSLDDYHFIPFLLGSAQLMKPPASVTEKDFSQQDKMPRQMAYRPKHSLRHDLQEELADQNMYMRAIQRIRELKSGPFNEHSPLLTDLAGLGSWEDVNKGLFNMFEGEVLGKFPVVQHFLFGPLFPADWEVDTAGAAAASAERGPMAGAKPMGDALVNYFGVSARKPLVAPAGGDQDLNENPVKVPHTLLENNSGIEIAGFRIETSKKRISSEAEMEDKGLDFPPPEMLFGGNQVSFYHEESDTLLKFDPFDAVKGCMIKLDQNGNPDRSVFKLPNSKSWENRKGSDGNKIEEWRSDYDWTYTTLYSGTILQKQEPVSLPEEESSTKIDYKRLKERDPILFFDEVCLFEDDLFDNGESKYTVKLRVMPSCFFVLARFWLRVDNTYVRCFDTRVYHAFETNHLLLEITRKEMSAEALTSKGFSDLKIMMQEERMEKLMQPFLLKTHKIQL